MNAYYETYDLNTVITRCSNNYGPYHFPEKLIPLFVTNALEGKKLPIYGDGSNVRDWLHVKVTPCTSEEFKRPAPRPKYSVFDHMSLRINGFKKIRSWEEALKYYLEENNKS